MEAGAQAGDGRRRRSAGKKDEKYVGERIRPRPSDPRTPWGGAIASARLDRVCAGVPTPRGVFPDRFIPACATSSKTSSKLLSSVAASYRNLY